MSFVSKGTEEQVESAASIALATHHGVPLSIVTVDATVQYYRRLMTARGLTSSKSWTVDYLMIADEATIDRVYDSATKLSDADNATALELFAYLLMTALSDEGVDSSEPLQILHKAPQRLVITASSRTAAAATTRTTAEELAPKAAEPFVGVVVVGTAVSACALACCFEKYRRRRRIGGAQKGAGRGGRAS